MWPPRIPATMFLASAHPSHHVFQLSDFVLYLESGLEEVLENQSVCSIYYIPDILIDSKLDFNATTIPRYCYIILLLYYLTIISLTIISYYYYILTRYSQFIF